MTKLEEGDVLTVEMINEAVEKIKLLNPRMKPVRIGDKDYYIWVDSRDSGMVQVEGHAATEQLDSLWKAVGANKSE